MKYLTRLNFSKDKSKDTIVLYNEIESFFLKNQPRLHPDFISTVTLTQKNSSKIPRK